MLTQSRDINCARSKKISSSAKLQLFFKKHVTLFDIKTTSATNTWGILIPRVYNLTQRNKDLAHIGIFSGCVVLQLHLEIYRGCYFLFYIFGIIVYLQKIQPQNNELYMDFILKRNHSRKLRS